MAKIAVESDPSVPTISSRVLAAGVGWTVSDIVCTAGPRDRPFEENHSAVSVSVVAGGSFQYRSTSGRALMTPGSVLLGNAGQSFECSHEHGCGDHCIAFQFTAEFFEEIAADAGASRNFRIARLPYLRSLAPLITRACAGIDSASEISWRSSQSISPAHPHVLPMSSPPASSPCQPVRSPALPASSGASNSRSRSR